MISLDLFPSLSLDYLLRFELVLLHCLVCSSSKSRDGGYHSLVIESDEDKVSLDLE
jgi:hypothetical protein